MYQNGAKSLGIAFDELVERVWKQHHRGNRTPRRVVAYLSNCANTARSSVVWECQAPVWEYITHIKRRANAGFFRAVMKKLRCGNSWRDLQI